LFPAKIFDPFVANEMTLEFVGKLLLTAIQLLPLLVDKNTPSSVLAKIFDPLMVNE